MGKKKKSKAKDIKIKIIVVLFILLMAVLIYTNIKRANDESLQVSAKTSSLFEGVDGTKSAKVTKYIVYGTHLNLEGEVEITKISGICITNVSLVQKNLDGKEQTINSKYEYTDGVLTFSSFEQLNEGIYLDNLTEDNYIFLKVNFSNGDLKTYSLSNDTEYENTTYYTITKNNSNNKIDIKFSEYNNKPYLKLEVSKVNKLPDDVYDVVIDPGHGGRDIGATSKGYYEASIVLDCAKTLKQKLEDLGLKVLLTRDGTEPSTLETAYNMYDDDGRVTIANESHAKILISLHMNSNSAKLSKGGVEVYAPSNCNLDLAQLFADNIVKFANTSYSSLTTYKKGEGVYVQNYNTLDIKAAENKAKKAGYEPYNITTSTPYLYIIRETGGIATNAYVDGRNTSYGANKYKDSNVGIESYLIELGYMIIEKDLNNVLENEDLYMQGIANSIEEYYDL